MTSSRNLSGCQVFLESVLPSDWDCVPLGERVDLRYGRALPEEDRQPGEIDVFGSNGKVGTHNVGWLPPPGIVVGRKGTVGAVHYTDRPFWPIDTAYYAIAKQDDDFLYLYYLLKYLPLASLNAATGVPGLSRRDAYALRGAFPPPSEQTTIAHVLAAADEALDYTGAAIECAREVKRAILQRFFYESLGETAYADRPKQRLPAGWSLTTTEALLAEEPKNGVSPEAFNRPPGTPTFSIAAIRDGRIDLHNQAHLKYTRISEAVAVKYHLRRGDVLIVRGNANPALVGKAGMVIDVPDGCIYPDIVKRVVFRSEGEPKVSPAFGVLAWNHPVVHNQVLRKAKTSNGTLKINNRDVRQVVMPVPSELEQAQLVSAVAGVEAQIDALTAVSVAQTLLKRALTHDLLNGRVRLTSKTTLGVS